jgi:hypothetical protein
MALMPPNQAVIAAIIEPNLHGRLSRALPKLNRLRCRSLLLS